MPACVEKGVDAELAVYPREGHGLRERAHRMRRLGTHARLVRPLSQAGRVDDAGGARPLHPAAARRRGPAPLIISFGVFALVHLAPGDPVRALLGSRPSNAETHRGDPRASFT